MSMQSVNLYLPELRERQEWLTANTLVILLLGFVVIMFGSSMMMQSNLEDYQKQVELIEAQKKASEERIAKITAKARSVNAFQLDKKLNQLRRSVLAREQIGQIIQGQNLGNEAGFSASMLGLARQSYDTISLQRFRISRGGTFVEMKGLTRNVKDVPLYLQGLQQEPSFLAAQFGLLSITGSKINSRQHEFALGFDSLYQLASEQDGGKR
ncbi:MAG: hypothetical protein K6L76_00130 [Agarilytica sp.]